MANIIKIGSTFVNLDNITHISGGDNDTLWVYINCSSEYEDGQHGVAFYGDEAAALRLYLTNTAIDVMKPYHAGKVESARGCTCDECRAADSIAEQNAEYYASVLTVR